MNAPKNPETLELMKQRFELCKEHMTERCLDSGITATPTDKDVWGQMRATAVQRQEEAYADDMEFYIYVHANRIKIIDEQMKLL